MAPERTNELRTTATTRRRGEPVRLEIEGVSLDHTDGDLHPVGLGFQSARLHRTDPIAVSLALAPVERQVEPLRQIHRGGIIHVRGQPLARTNGESLDRRVTADRLQTIQIGGECHEPVETLHDHRQRLLRPVRVRKCDDLVAEVTLPRLTITTLGADPVQRTEPELDSIHRLIGPQLAALAQVVHHASLQIRPVRTQVLRTLSRGQTGHHPEVMVDPAVQIRHGHLVVHHVDTRPVGTTAGTCHEAHESRECEQAEHPAPELLEKARHLDPESLQDVGHVTSFTLLLSVDIIITLPY